MINDQMYVLYGCGQYLRAIVDQYDIPCDNISAIIDNELAKRVDESGIIPIISAKQYFSKRFRNEEIFVICAKTRYKEILDDLLSNGVKEQNIIYIDEWVARYSKTKDKLREFVNRVEDEFIEKKCAEVGLIHSTLLREARVFSNREYALELIPTNAVVAEVGVAFGDLSRIIIDKSSPKEFYALDVFSDKTKGFWGDNRFEDGGVTHLEYYENRFSKEINSGILRIRQGLSWDCLLKFPDDYFDYVYLDAAHDYNSVKKDTEILKRKVKKGGLIQFNDYTRNESYGTIPVINEFVNTTNSEVVGYALSMSGYDDIIVRNNK